MARFVIKVALFRNLFPVYYIKYISSTSGHVKEEYSKVKETHFGYSRVSEEEKADKVHEVFQNVAAKYDTMNDLMSGGIHRLWKDYFINKLHPRPHTRLLDVAGGTGDIAFRFIEQILYQTKSQSIESLSLPHAFPSAFSHTNDLTEDEEQESLSQYEVTVCDISQGMLDIGQARAKEKDFNTINWVCGDAQKLPFENDQFDCYTICFGIRNVVDIVKVLDEAYRVLRPGGRFMCMEFSRVSNPGVKWLYDTYSFQVIPPMGQVIAGDWASYQYLVESIRKFPDQETFKEMIENSGFRQVTYTNLSFGITAIHSGFKL